MQDDFPLSSAIGRRRSIRRYLPRPVDPSAIERLMVAATQAPSAHHRQPWRFVVVSGLAIKNKLALAMGDRLRADRAADGDDQRQIDSDVSRSRMRIAESPVAIVVCLDTQTMDTYPDPRRRNAEHLMAVQGTAMAAQNLLLAAEQEGLGACVMCAPLFCPDTIAAALELPDNWQAQMLITVGHPAGPGRQRERQPLSDVVVWRS